MHYHKRRQTCHSKDYCLKAQDFFNQQTMIIKNPFRDDGIDGFIANYKRMYPSCLCPSTPTVYRLIDQDQLAIKNYDLPRKVRLRHLGHHRKRTRQHKKCLSNSIEQRPKVAGRFEIVIKIPDYKADTCFKAVQKAVNEHSSWFKTITFDNGSEFARIDEVKGVNAYFAHPYTPSERGSNENANGLLQEFFPKGKTMSKVTDKYVKRAQNALNNKHRRILGYQTAREVFMAETA
ncbi:IS30 family transposase [Lactobacillus sp. ESL0791]|uniref:IS30 family transposase n=1 Tax=Lactobacillus sp. ESL0791 TaxID=2983234 RepID=UPI0023F7D9DC|nr:IS30 family transposase [Lactobacillus sp. ESL0791]MDF7639644.1 IS30 family transposase [Lactobacillus sp. ESL0791]